MGEEEFLWQVMLRRRYGAAVVVFAFDEQSPAASFEEKLRICQSSYKVLRQKVDFPPEVKGI